VNRDDPHGVVVPLQAQLVFLGRLLFLVHLFGQPLQQAGDAQPALRFGVVQDFAEMEDVGEPALAVREGQQALPHLLPLQPVAEHPEKAVAAPELEVVVEDLEPVVPLGFSALRQLAAIDGAIRAAARVIVSRHLESCFEEATASEQQRVRVLQEGIEGEAQPVANLAAVQRGDKIVAQFTVPTLTTEGQPLKPPVTLDLRIGERRSADLRFDATNFLNHVNYTQYNTTVGAAQFGILQSPSGMRVFQATLRFRF